METILQVQEGVLVRIMSCYLSPGWWWRLGKCLVLSESLCWSYCWMCIKVSVFPDVTAAQLSTPQSPDNGEKVLTDNITPVRPCPCPGLWVVRWLS